MPEGGAPRARFAHSHLQDFLVGGERRRVPTKVVKKPVVPNHSLEVRYWHSAEIQEGRPKVRF
jgi:hypothetical protein